MPGFSAFRPCITVSLPARYTIHSFVYYRCVQFLLTRHLDNDKLAKEFRTIFHRQIEKIQHERRNRDFGVQIFFTSPASIGNYIFPVSLNCIKLFIHKFIKRDKAIAIEVSYLQNFRRKI